MRPVREKYKIEGMKPVAVYTNPVEIPEKYCDSYGNHLNNALALKLFEEERTRLFDKTGAHTEDYGLLGYVRQQAPMYLSQIFGGEVLNLRTTLYVVGAVALFHHVIERDGKPALDNLVEFAIIDTEGRPTRIPQPLVDQFAGGCKYF
ncbi:MAG TPA: thioesterase family protein [Candidatus Nanoarchaeia archaeon]|nr:thioesterase family protein [Candidatus Nanoarchaeia archaeon]